MTTTAAAINEKIGEFLPARVTAPGKMPWIPLSPTKSFQPLRFFSDKRGFVELLRIEPGEEILLHRHTGEVHAFNLQGSRLLSSGELIGPGEYVYEPAGNVDSWKVVGDIPLITLVVVMGDIEYLGPDNQVVDSFTPERLQTVYREYCKANNIEVLDLVD